MRIPPSQGVGNLLFVIVGTPRLPGGKCAPEGGSVSGSAPLWPAHPGVLAEFPKTMCPPASPGEAASHLQRVPTPAAVRVRALPFMGQQPFPSQCWGNQPQGLSNSHFQGHNLHTHSSEGSQHLHSFGLHHEHSEVCRLVLPRPSEFSFVLKHQQETKLFATTATVCCVLTWSQIPFWKTIKYLHFNSYNHSHNIVHFYIEGRCGSWGLAQSLG